MEKVIIMIPVLVIVGFLGVTIGMYISSQIKCSIRKNILNNNIDKHENKSK
jgi:xanthosine utilization system XapX-like protein